MCVTELSPHRPKKRQLASDVDAIVREERQGRVDGVYWRRSLSQQRYAISTYPLVNYFAFILSVRTPR